MSTTPSLKSTISYEFIDGMLTPVIRDNTPPKPENASVYSRPSSSLIDSMEEGQKAPEAPPLRPMGVKVLFSANLSNYSGS
jgi:hypothetical protein